MCQGSWTDFSELSYTGNILTYDHQIYLKTYQGQNPSLSVNSSISNKQRGISITCLEENITNYEKSSSLLMLTQNLPERERKAIMWSDQEVGHLLLVLVVSSPDRREP